jgi:hypothetical protein
MPGAAGEEEVGDSGQVSPVIGWGEGRRLRNVQIADNGKVSAIS